MAYLDILNINKLFGAFRAVDDFNLRIEKGEFVSFLGPSGCGKTTTLRMVAGFETPTSGTITLDGEDITRKAPNQRNVGMVFQSYALFPNMSVVDNIGFGLKVSHHPAQEISQRVQEMLKIIHMENFGKRYPSQLSGGQQQRVALARALAIRPRVLLLDEPLSALDAKIRIELRHEIRAIQRSLGITTIYVTHDQEEALSLSDRVVVMKDGKTEQIGAPFEIYNFPRTPFVASFVGTLNILEAQVQDSAAGMLAVEGQALAAAGALQAANGSPVKMALRPEILSLQPGDEPQNQLTAVVDTVTFLGSIVRVQGRVGAQKLSCDMFNHPSFIAPRVGESVTLYFPRQACLVLDLKN